MTEIILLKRDFKKLQERLELLENKSNRKTLTYFIVDGIRFDTHISTSKNLVDAIQYICEQIGARNLAKKFPSKFSDNISDFPLGSVDHLTKMGKYYLNTHNKSEEKRKFMNDVANEFSLKIEFEIIEKKATA